MIIDIHAHAFPDKIYERTIKILEDNILQYGGYEYHAVGSGNLDGLKLSMAQNNIDCSVVLPIATAPHQTESINSFASQINAKNGIYSFGSLHPDCDDIDGILEHIAELGLRGIKLHPDYQKFYIDSPQSLRILKKCEALGLYVILHTGKDHGCEPPFHCTPERLAHVLDYVSGSNIIAAHMGGWNMWDDAEKYIIGSPIMTDTTFCLHFMNPAQAKRMILTHGADKVLFGTDWPWYSQRKTAGELRSLGLADDVLEKIFHKNAARILGID